MSMAKLLVPGRVLGRVALAAVLVTGILLATGLARTGATIGVSWGTTVLPFSVPDNDCGNELAVDGMGNIFTLTSATGISRYTPSTSTNVTLDGSRTFGFCSYFTVNSAGDVFVANSSDHIIYEISPAGTETVVTASLANPGPLATDAGGNLYAFDFATSTIYEIVGGTPNVFHTVSISVNSMAVALDGSVYVSDYGANVQRVTPSSVTPVGSGWSEAESVAVDGAGNVYVAAESATSLTELPVAGSQDVLTATADSSGCGDEAFVGGSTLYYFDECNTTTLYTLGVTQLASLNRPTGLSVTSSNQPFQGALHQTLTATWHLVPNATSYTCSLMYGWTEPSQYTVTTASPICWFQGLDLTTEYGIAVVANNGLVTSLPSTAFATPTPVPAPPPPAPSKVRTIVCQKNHSQRLRVVTRVNPRCPRGWHRVS
jgi:hypothetical protein